MKSFPLILAVMVIMSISESAIAQVQTPWFKGLSAEARQGLIDNAARKPAHNLPDQRLAILAIQQDIGTRQMARYHVTMTEGTLAGVPVRIFTPANPLDDGSILLNFHGGGFIIDSGSWTENIPLAALTRRRVVTALYRMAPEHPFPAAVDDASAVYRELLKTHPADKIVVFGTSAGAVLSAELVQRLRQDRVPQPAALGFFSGTGDFANLGDSAPVYGGPAASALMLSPYTVGHSLSDPALSPAYGDLSGWPPTLCVSSTRDILLSATAIFCHKLDEAGSPAKLVVFDALPHAFWSYIEAPESDAAFETMARFINTALSRPGKHP
jgi:acetyl esterase/lipase